MAVSGGPDEETWKKMSPTAKRMYWICVGIVWFFIGGLFIYGYLN